MCTDHPKAKETQPTLDADEIADSLTGCVIKKGGVFFQCLHQVFSTTSSCVSIFFFVISLSDWLGRRRFRGCGGGALIMHAMRGGRKGWREGDVRISPSHSILEKREEEEKPRHMDVSISHLLLMQLVRPLHFCPLSPPSQNDVTYTHIFLSGFPISRPAQKN